MSTQFRLYGTRHAGLKPVTFTLQTRTPGDPAVIAPVDLTGAAITATIRQYPNEDAYLIHALTVEPVDLAAGKYRVLLPEAEADAVPVGAWWWDTRIDPATDDAWYPLAPSPFIWESVVTLP